MNREDLLDQIMRLPPGHESAGFLPTGSVSLDSLLGGGWPAGAVSEIAGPPGYADPLAYRMISAVQRAYPRKSAVLCSASFSIMLAKQHGIDRDRLMCTDHPGEAVSLTEREGVCLTVIDSPLSREAPVRPDTSLSMLYLTVFPGDVRSAACIRMSPYSSSRGWAWAERMWCSYPVSTAYSGMPAALRGSSAFVQEMLDAAVAAGVVEVRGRWYSYGGRQLGGSWETATHEIEDDPGLRTGILGELAGLMPVYPGWRYAYTGK